MPNFDIVLLTDARYVNPKEHNAYIKNVLQEDELVIKALHSKELKVKRVAWSDTAFDWSTTKYALFRATWDYFHRYKEFLLWFERAAVQTQFINSRALIEWNIDKHYLFDLQKKGVTIPKTLLIEPKTNTTLHESMVKAKNELNFMGKDFVLKPCIAGGARHTYKINETDVSTHEVLFQQLLDEEAMLLQEFQKNIVSKGEISMMVFDGCFTHAVLKVAKPGDFRVQDDYGGSVHKYQPSKEEIEFSEAVVRACPNQPIYARVDIFEDNEGNLALAELEIFEPELWFRLQPKAAEDLAKAIHKKYFI